MRGYAVVGAAKALIGLGALFATVHANYYNGTTFPATNQKTLTAEDHCPDTCPSGSIGQDDFSTIRTLRDLNKCPKPLILQTSIGFPLESEDGQTIISACSIPSGGAQAKSSTAACVAPKNRTTVPVDLQLGFKEPGKGNASLADLISSANDLKRVLLNDASCGAKSYFAKNGHAVVGLYAGAEISRDSVTSLVQSFIDSIKERGTIASETTLQLCGKNGTRTQQKSQTFGIQASLTGDVTAVHDALGSWAKANCINAFDETETLHRRITTLAGSDVFKARRQSAASSDAHSQKQKRATCAKYEIVVSGSNCDGLAQKCGIKVDELVKYNNGGSANKWCPQLKPNTPVCCSAGNLPDLRPKPNGDGSCAMHQLEPGQFCHDVEELYHLKKDVDLDKFNVGKTWGWAGCTKLQKGMKFCVSEGKPPMPTWNKDALCGPTKPGTRAPTQQGVDISLLNPCPLRACCNIWGQCGTTEEFCIDARVKDTPGTSEEGIDGCVSNCGTDIVNDDEPPAEFSRIAYFEAWNRERPCLHMDVTEIGKPHTHIHFAFGDITEDFQVSAKGVEGQFKKFVGMKGIKRIISFGGWAFSNEAGTSHIMRNGVKAANRDKFAKNVAKFIGDNNLDGVDFDWEYPGADDIPGSDPGTAEDGNNYLLFLRLVRAELDKLGEGKLLAIAAPASYWYLRNFPIAQMSRVVDYIVYMSYDLHGQWDVGNKFVSPGCPEGNCVRSHVNYTATLNSLSMITKAGVKSNKVMVGITSYARSFKLVDPGCTGFLCKYLGGRNDSPAMPGKCTETGGYLADAEVEMIKDAGRYKIKEFYDSDSDSDIMIYNNDEWLAYMTSTTKERRVRGYKDMNFAGASDWAIDLHGSIKDDEGELVFIGPEVYKTPAMQCHPPCTLVLAPSPLQGTSTITIPAYTTSIQAGTKTITVTVTPDPLTVTEIDFFNVPITAGNETDQIIPVQPYPSLSVPDEIITVSYTNSGSTITTTRTILLPPWPIITNGPPEPGETDWNKPPSINGTFETPDNTIFPGLSTYQTPTPTWKWGEIPVTIRPIPPEEIPTKLPEPVVENPDCDDGDCENDDDDDDNDHSQRIKVPCDIWFFNICAFSKNWQFILPPGRIGPGPPPINQIKPPPGMTVIGPLPPWPKFTIPTGPAPLSVPDKPANCETKAASICGTTTSYGISEGVTTKTSSYSTCATIYGCNVDDYEEETTTNAGCPIPTMPPVRRGLPRAVAAATGLETAQAAETSVASPPKLSDSLLSDEDFEDDVESKVDARADDPVPTGCERKAVLIFPKSIFQTVSIVRALTYLQDNKYIKAWTEIGGLRGHSKEYTAWFYVEDFPAVSESLILSLREVSGVISPVEHYMRTCPNRVKPRDLETRATDFENAAQNLTKREGGGPTLSDDYGNAFLSYPAGRLQPKMYGDSTFIENNQYKYWSDSSAGQGQRIYVIDGFPQDNLKQHPEFANSNVANTRFMPDWYTAGDTELLYGNHGFQCASVAMGETLGVAPKAELVPIAVQLASRVEFPYYHVQGMMTVLDELYDNPSLSQRSVVSMSIAFMQSCFAPQFVRVWEQIIDLYVSQDILIVNSAGNDGGNAEALLPNSILLNKRFGIIGGSSNRFGQWTQSSNRPSNRNALDELMVFSSGHQVKVAEFDRNRLYILTDGTSYATPRIAGLAAYLRSVDSNFKEALKSSRNVRSMMNQLKRFLQPSDVPSSFDGDRGSPQVAVKHAWNGQVPGDADSMIDEHQISRSCLQQKQILWPPIVNDGDCQYNVCPKLRLGGITARSVYSDAELAKRQEACSLPGSPNGPPSNIEGIPVPPPIEWGPGAPNPVCESHCGTPCEGFWCSPRPTGTPPDFEDPDPPSTDPGPGPEDPPDEPDEPDEPKYDHADPSKNEKQCFNSGYKSNHETLVYAAESFCRNLKNFKNCDTGYGHPCGTEWKPGCSMKCKKNPTGNRHVILEIKVKEGCSWVPDYDECLRYLKVPINSCNCGGTGGKQGGKVENNCIYAMIDPNFGV